eukprot:1972572-Pleurochrysis_carterae.AAC.1
MKLGHALRPVSKNAHYAQQENLLNSLIQNCMLTCQPTCRVSPSVVLLISFVSFAPQCQWKDEARSKKPRLYRKHDLLHAFFHKQLLRKVVTTPQRKDGVSPFSSITHAAAST